MVRAILDGRKSQTRRVVKYKIKGPAEFGIYDWFKKTKDALKWVGAWSSNNLRDNNILQHCPYGMPGDVLWVRETFGFALSFAGFLAGDLTINYRADGGQVIATGDQVDLFQSLPKWHENWRSSLHMNRGFSRINLLIKDVRVERLQDISRKDAISEGVDYKTCGAYQTAEDIEMSARSLSSFATIDYIDGFKNLWDSINAKKHPWEGNPWVWVVEFEVDD